MRGCIILDRREAVVMLGEKIKQLRKSKGVTQADLAQAMGLSQQAIARWEVNRSEPDNETMCRLASYFGVSSDYLLGIPIHAQADTERRTDNLQFAAILRRLQTDINLAFDKAIAEALQGENRDAKGA